MTRQTTNDSSADRDADIQRWFAEADQPLHGAAFTAQVLQRTRGIRKYAWLRYRAVVVSRLLATLLVVTGYLVLAPVLEIPLISNLAGSPWIDPVNSVGSLLVFTAGLFWLLLRRLWR